MNKIALLVLLLAAIGCRSETAGLPADAYEAEVEAVVALTLAADPALVAPDGNSPSPSPDDWKKPGAECRNCYGTGRSGDGLSQCKTCGGDGRIDERDITATPPAIGTSQVQCDCSSGTKCICQPEHCACANCPEHNAPREQSASSTRTIVMHVSRATAKGWPQKWWRDTRPGLVADGWHVPDPILEVGPIDEPWFIVCEGNKCRKLVGEQPYKAF